MKEISELRNKRSKLVFKISNQRKWAKEVIKKAEDAIEEYKREVKNLDKQILEISDSPHTITFTDHAFVRYFERVLKIDLNKLEEEILPLGARHKIKGLTNCKLPVETDLGKFTLVIKDRAIITITNQEDE